MFLLVEAGGHPWRVDRGASAAERASTPRPSEGTAAERRARAETPTAVPCFMTRASFVETSNSDELLPAGVSLALNDGAICQWAWMQTAAVSEMAPVILRLWAQLWCVMAETLTQFRSVCFVKHYGAFRKNLGGEVRKQQASWVALDLTHTLTHSCGDGLAEDGMTNTFCSPAFLWVSNGTAKRVSHWVRLTERCRSQHFHSALPVWKTSDTSPPQIHTFLTKPPARQWNQPFSGHSEGKDGNPSCSHSAGRNCQENSGHESRVWQLKSAGHYQFLI